MPTRRQEQERLQAELAALDAAHAARVADMEALAAGSSRVSAMTAHYDKVLADLAAERDSLQRERASLLQVPFPPHAALHGPPLGALQ
jgi:hypothetical protein